MLGTLIGGAIIGGIVTGCAKNKASKVKAERELERQSQVLERFLSSPSSYSSSGTRVVTKTVVKKVEDPKLKLQTSFFDKFRALDNQLARMTRDGYKGVTNLIKGLEVTHGSERLIRALKNIRNYRNRISHDKRQWKQMPAPTPALMGDLRYAQGWVNDNTAKAGQLAWKGKNAFARMNSKHSNYRK